MDGFELYRGTTKLGDRCLSVLREVSSEQVCYDVYHSINAASVYELRDDLLVQVELSDLRGLRLNQDSFNARNVAMVQNVGFLGVLNAHVKRVHFTQLRFDWTVEVCVRLLDSSHHSQHFSLQAIVHLREHTIGVGLTPNF